MIKTFKQLTERFEYVNSDIEPNFTIEEPRSQEYKLYSFDIYISSEEVVAEMERDGYAPATLGELLYWEGWNEQDWVVGLGSVAEVNGYRRVPDLYGGSSGRDLRLRWWGSGWDRSCRFLAVRTESLESQGGLSEPLALPKELVINGITYLRHD